MADDIGEVLDGIDDVTARLIIELQFHDSVQSSSSDSQRIRDTFSADFGLARSLYARELCEYRDDRWKDGCAEDGQDAEEDRDMRECIICEDRLPWEDCTLLHDDHCFCRTCLDSLFQIAMNTRDAYPPRCCGHIADFAELRHLLDPELAEDFAAKQPELEDPAPLYCHNPNCSAYLPENHRFGTFALCTAGFKRTYIFCKGKSHLGDSPPDEATQQTLDLAEAQGWQRCPSCRTVVELRSGCNHIT